TGPEETGMSQLAPAVCCLSRTPIATSTPSHQSSPPIGIQILAPAVWTNQRAQPRTRTPALLDAFEWVLTLGAAEVAFAHRKARPQIETGDVYRTGCWGERRSPHWESVPKQ